MTITNVALSMLISCLVVPYVRCKGLAFCLCWLAGLQVDELTSLHVNELMELRVLGLVS